MVEPAGPMPHGLDVAKGLISLGVPVVQRFVHRVELRPGPRRVSYLWQRLGQQGSHVSGVAGPCEFGGYASLGNVCLENMRLVLTEFPIPLAMSSLANLHAMRHALRHVDIDLGLAKDLVIVSGLQD